MFKGKGLKPPGYQAPFSYGSWGVNVRRRPTAQSNAKFLRSFARRSSRGVSGTQLAFESKRLETRISHSMFKG
jgi:hypothetical protein